MQQSVNALENSPRALAQSLVNPDAVPMSDQLPVTLLPPHAISLRGERSALRVAVVYGEEGYIPLPAEAENPPVFGYALEPAIYRVRILQDEPLGLGGDGLPPAPERR